MTVMRPIETQEQIKRDNLIGRISQTLCSQLWMVISPEYTQRHLEIVLDMLEDSKMGDVLFFGGREAARLYFLGLLRLLVMDLQDEIEKRIEKILAATYLSWELWEEEDFDLWYKESLKGIRESQ